jgi:hypothetical protein
MMCSRFSVSFIRLTLNRVVILCSISFTFDVSPFNAHPRFADMALSPAHPTLLPTSEHHCSGVVLITTPFEVKHEVQSGSCSNAPASRCYATISVTATTSPGLLCFPGLLQIKYHTSSLHVSFGTAQLTWNNHTFTSSPMHQSPQRHRFSGIRGWKPICLVIIYNLIHFQSTRFPCGAAPPSIRIRSMSVLATKQSAIAARRKEYFDDVNNVVCVS